MRCSLTLEIKSGGKTSYKACYGCVGFTFEKALYVPYTKFSGVFYEDGRPDITAGQVVSIRAYLNGREIHYGMPDRVSIIRGSHGYRIQVSSRGYTLLLAQNEPYPRVNSNVTLKSLCRKNLDCDRISYEDPTPNVSYIYVREGSSVWEAAVAYCIKAKGNYPYIRGTNKVCLTMEDTENIVYEDCALTTAETSADSSMILSDVYMKELEDDYPFEAHDSSAADMGIVRSRYFDLDMQWLYDAQTGLQHKLDMSNRGVRTRSMTYEGWQGEDLMDRAYHPEGIPNLRINFIRITGGKRGIFTTVRAYEDRYGQRRA